MAGVSSPTRATCGCRAIRKGSAPLSWSGDGNWLATSGAEAAIVWPFDSKDGPTGKPPRECGVRPARVTQVAFHPKALVLAMGYEDGCILLVRFTDAAELLVRPAVQGSAVTAIAWDGRGGRLAFGCKDGKAGFSPSPPESVYQAPKRAR